MFIVFLNSHKRVRKFIDSLGKEERKRIKYVLITDSDGEDIIDLIPKKADYKILSVLIPPQDLFIQKLNGHISKKEFQEEYYRYLTRPICRAALVKIAKANIIDGKDVAVCFGVYENDMDVAKYIQRSFESLLPDIEIFDYKDWKDNANDVINYSPDNIGTISIQISEYADQIGRKLMELESCKDKYSRHNFYNDEE